MKRQLLLNVSHLAVEQRRLLQLFGRREEEEEAYFVDYIPPARDAINLPPNVIYGLVGLLLVIIATYAIVGHLIKDLMHDLAGNAPTPHRPPECLVTSPITLSSLMDLFLASSSSLKARLHLCFSPVFLLFC